MIVGEVSQGIGHPFSDEGLIVPFENDYDPYRLFIPNEQVNIIAANAVLNSQRMTEKVLIALEGEAPTHQIHTVQTLGFRENIAHTSTAFTVMTLSTMEAEDFRGIAFSANRKIGRWKMMEKEEAADQEYLDVLALDMALNLLTKFSETQRESLTEREKQLIARNGYVLNSTSFES